MAFKKSKLFSAIWDGCNKLRGGMDSSQYKDYVLTLLFVKYASDKANTPNSIIVVPEGSTFEDFTGLKKNVEIGDKINQKLAALAKENDLVGVIDVVDFNDPAKLGQGKDMVDRLSGLVSIFEHPGLDFKKHRAARDDILGDAYEFLMKRFATESGKSKGQFYTPSKISTLLARLVGAHRAKQGQTVYDPTCGSGSLLLRCCAEARDFAGVELSVYGQEMDLSTYGLSKINMVIHGLADALIQQGNTLSDPKFKRDTVSQMVDGVEKAITPLKQFDHVVANPPFSIKEWMTGVDPLNDPFDRFGLGIPPDKNGDYAFLLHIVASTNATGKAAVVLPHGVLFRGNAEGIIRKNLIKTGWVKAIIGLPANLFYGTGIPACIIVIDKEDADKRKGVFFIDASKGFIKDGNKNALQEQDMHKIIDAYENGVEVDKFSRLVSYKEIEENEWNLNIPRYIDSNEVEDIQDLGGHLQGGIPETDISSMKDLWGQCPSLRDELFETMRTGYVKLKVPSEDIKKIFDNNQEFNTLAKSIASAFKEWEQKAVEDFKKTQVNDKESALIVEVGGLLLKNFSEVPMVDKYSMYQHLMTVWEEFMHDDVSAIVLDGWLSCKELSEVTAKDEESNIVIGSGKNQKRYQSDIIDPKDVASRFFANDVLALDQAKLKLEASEQLIASLMEEEGVEGGFLADFIEDGKWKAAEKATEAKKAQPNGLKRLELISDLVSEFGNDNAKKVQQLLKNIEDRPALAMDATQKSDALWLSVVEKMGALTEEEIKDLMIVDKWIARIKLAIESEVSEVTQQKTSRIEDLGSRYALKLDDLQVQRDALTKKNEENMKLLGF